MEEEVKEMLKAEGSDLVGIASVDRFEKALPGCKPTDIMSQAKAVIVMAVRIPKGILESGNLRLVTNAWNMANAELNRVAFKGARFLEDQGYRSVVISPFLPVNILERHGLVGDLSLKHAGAMAGLGVMGFNDLLITPRFGPRQRLVALVTDTPLEADPLLEENFCAQCREKHCIDACPVGAIKGKMEIDKLRCLDQYQRFGGKNS